jgi:hypothetical protein
MTNQTSYSAEVNCYIEQQSVTVASSTDSLIFVYSLTEDITIENEELNKVVVGHLAKLQAFNQIEDNKPETSVISGRDMIVIEFKPVCLKS